ncbi:hypothetical protein ACET3Z_013121 [Daucus carota]
MSESRSRGKVGSSNEQGSMKKNACMSVWSEEDDVSLMQGMIDYEEQKQASPYDDLGKFLDFVKPRLHFDVQRKQLTDKLWKLRNKFVNSSYNLSKAHHAKLFELAKLIQSWGHGENVGLDCGKGENVGSGDDGNGGKEKKSKVGRNKQRGELVVDGGLNGEKGNVGVDGDVCVNKVKKKKFVNEDGQIVKENEGVSGVVKSGKKSKVGRKKQNEELVADDGQIGEKDNVGMDDDGHVNMGMEVVKQKRKFANEDGQIVKDNEGISGVVKSGKKSKVGRKKQNEELVANDGQIGEKDNVGMDDDVHVNMGMEVVKQKKKFVNEDGQIVEENEGISGVVKSGKKSKVGRKKQNEELVADDGQIGEKDNMGINDVVHVNMGMEVVKQKKKFVNEDGQIVKETEGSPSVVKSGKKSKVDRKKQKEELVANDGQIGEKDNVGMDDDVHVNTGMKLPPLSSE